MGLLHILNDPSKAQVFEGIVLVAGGIVCKTPPRHLGKFENLGALFLWLVIKHDKLEYHPFTGNNRE